MSNKVIDAITVFLYQPSWEPGRASKLSLEEAAVCYSEAVILHMYLQYEEKKSIFACLRESKSAICSIATALNGTRPVYISYLMYLDSSEPKPNTTRSS